ncbi:MAG: virulence RhuM family protein [Dysgonamonadaceae bacterium]|nr:virulence RhuM family protein [Dysgonamonadaceae bacterium]
MNENQEILIYQLADGTAKVDVRFENETIWLTNRQLTELFQTTKSNVSEHIKHIFEEGELSYDSTVRKFRTVAANGKTYEMEHYNLDMIISLGYRINSLVATSFRIWATQRLKEYIVKGFTMDDERLKGNGGGRYWYELLDRIRDIRSSEKVLYRQVLDLYATSIDYNPRAAESIKFFQIVQNKLHYAAHGHTAAEIIAARANAGKPFMGLLSFSGSGVSKKDISIAKNYLEQRELKILNNIVSSFFDLAEVKAMEHKPMYMKDWIAQLDKLIATFDKTILQHSGTVSRDKALEKAEEEYRKYKAQEITPVEQAYLEELKTIEKTIKK